MSLTQLTSYAWVAFLAVVAVCVGVSTGIDYFAKKIKQAVTQASYDHR